MKVSVSRHSLIVGDPTQDLPESLVSDSTSARITPVRQKRETSGAPVLGMSGLTDSVSTIRTTALTLTREHHGVHQVLQTAVQRGTASSRKQIVGLHDIYGKIAKLEREVYTHKTVVNIPAVVHHQPTSLDRMMHKTSAAAHVDTHEVHAAHSDGHHGGLHHGSKWEFLAKGAGLIIGAAMPLIARYYIDSHVGSPGTTAPPPSPKSKDDKGFDWSKLLGGALTMWNPISSAKADTLDPKLIGKRPPSYDVKGDAGPIGRETSAAYKASITALSVHSLQRLDDMTRRYENVFRATQQRFTNMLNNDLQQDRQEQNWVKRQHAYGAGVNGSTGSNVTFDPATNTTHVRSPDGSETVLPGNYSQAGGSPTTSTGGQKWSIRHRGGDGKPPPASDIKMPEVNVNTTGPGMTRALSGQRAKFAAELKNNPALLERVLAISANEGGPFDDKGQHNQAVLESMMNRAAMMHTSLDIAARNVAQGGYYAGSPRWSALRSPKQKQALLDNLQKVLGGSNISNFATDNASQDLAVRDANSGKFVVQSNYGASHVIGRPGVETFFSPGSYGGRGGRKAYLAWAKGLQTEADRLGDGGAAAAAVSSTPSVSNAPQATNGAQTPSYSTASGGQDRLTIVGHAKSAGIEHVDPRLVSIMHNASKDLPPGWRAELYSGYRAGDPRFHGQGIAADIRLIDPNGNMVANYQDPHTFRIYERFAQSAKKYQTDLYPALDKDFRWGGYFSGPPGKYGAMDEMHYDLGLHGVMGGGSWDKGLSPAQKAIFGGNIETKGMGDVASWQHPVYSNYDAAKDVPAAPALEARTLRNYMGPVPVKQGAASNSSDVDGSKISYISAPEAPPALPAPAPPELRPEADDKASKSIVAKPPVDKPDEPVSKRLSVHSGISSNHEDINIPQYASGQ